MKTINELFQLDPSFTKLHESFGVSAERADHLALLYAQATAPMFMRIMTELIGRKTAMLEVSSHEALTAIRDATTRWNPSSDQEQAFAFTNIGMTYVGWKHKLDSLLAYMEERGAITVMDSKKADTEMEQMLDAMKQVLKDVDPRSN